MTQRNVLAAVLLLLVSALPATQDTTTLTLWPGFTIGLPAGYCVSLSRGPDFDVVSFRDQSAPKGPILAGIYAGHNPEDLECAKPTTRQWNANGLSLKSARGSDGCAEFLIQDPKKPERGFLHIWFGPAAKNNPRLAESVIASVRPAPLPVYRPDDLPTCK